ncbi:MAG: bifunctional pyr operon transcriptional regulator/uracil phosphoribosyltransferase PyrR [Fimbriimonadaceae bacterium]
MPEVLLDAAGMRRTLSRLAHEILDGNGGAEELVVVGILRRGYPVAKHLAFLMTQVEGVTIPCGKLDVRPYRDDLKVDVGADGTEIPFQINDRRVVLVDEVLFTGRTVRAALEGIMQQGRPKVVQFATLIDRGHRELPIQADYVGRKVETLRSDFITVKLNDFDGEDSVMLMNEAEMGALR